LLFVEGEAYNAALVEESERNLWNRGLFSDVRFLTDTLPGNLAHIRVITRERWTFSASAMFTQDAGVRSKYLSVSEQNLLGSGQKISLNYNQSSLRTGNPNGFQAGLEEHRLFGSRWRALFHYRDAEEHRAASLQVDRPFFSEDAEWSAGAVARQGRERLWYDPVNPQAEESFRFISVLRLWFIRSFGLGVKLRVGGAYLRSRMTALPQFIGTADSGDFLNLSGGILKRDFTQTSLIDEIGNVEYAQTGYGLSAIAGFNLSSIPERRNQLFLRAGSRTGVSLLRNLFVYTDISASTFTDFEQFRDATIRGQASFFNKVTARSTLVGRISLVRGFSWSPWKRVVLGGLGGLRGYRPWEFAGTSAALTNVEYRIFPDVEIMYFRSALAAFFDSGTTWWEQERFSNQKWHGAAGVGLRIANRRFLGSSVIRIDLAYNLATRQWGQIILSTDQLFRALGNVDTDSPATME
jgi:hypothetical protein